MSLDNVDVGAAAPANDTALTSTTTDTGAAPLTPAVADTGAAPAVTEKPKPTMDETMRATWDKLNPKRDPGGKFAARDGAPAQAAVAADGTTTETTELSADQTAEAAAEQAKAAQAAPSAIDAPSSWSAEMKAKWATVPPDVQAFVAKRETEAHQAITRAGQQIKAVEPVVNVLEQFGETFKRNNLPPAEGIARMLAVEQWLGQDPLAAIKGLAEAYGVDLKGLTGEQAAVAATADVPGTATPDPRLSTMEKKLAATQDELQKVTSYLTAQQRRELAAKQQQDREAETSLAREIAKFAEGKPHFEAVRKAMGALMQADESLTLDQAYERATYAHPDIRQRILTDQRKADEEKAAKDRAARADAAKKAGAVNVKSTTGSGKSPKTIDDTLRENAARLYAK